MYDYDDGMSRSEYRAARRARRSAHRAERWGIYPAEGIPQNYSPTQPADSYSPVQPPTGYEQQYMYQRATSLARQRAFLISSAISFVVFNAFLGLIWALSGSTYFWPGWITLLGAIGLIS